MEFPKTLYMALKAHWRNDSKVVTGLDWWKCRQAHSGGGIKNDLRSLSTDLEKSEKSSWHPRCRHPYSDRT